MICLPQTSRGSAKLPTLDVHHCQIGTSCSASRRTCCRCMLLSSPMASHDFLRAPLGSWDIHLLLGIAVTMWIINDNHMNKCEINPKTIHHRYLPSDSITFFVSEASTRKDTQKLSRFAPGHGKKWTKKVDGHPERDSPATSSYRSSLGKVSCSAHSHGTPASGRIKPKVIHGNPIPRSEVFRLNMLNIGKWSQS